jgi:DNA-binding CsgD family transcriptional regulator
VGSAPLALAGLRARIASLDRDGIVRWVNQAWSRLRQRQTGDSVAATAVGVDYIAVCSRSRDPAGTVLAYGIRAVLAQATSYVELDCDLGINAERRTQISVTPGPQGEPGALVTQVDVRATVGGSFGSAPAPADRAHHLEQLTPRESAVLSRMAHGLDNQAIADELHIGYATVRSHVRSLMAKLGARSRLEAVVRAVQFDFVQLPPSPEARDTTTVDLDGEDRQ